MNVLRRSPCTLISVEFACRYFARIAEERMGPDDQVILVTHQPRWLMDWFWEEAATHNLRQLVRGHLRGRARVHLAGPPPLPPCPALIYHF